MTKVPATIINFAKFQQARPAGFDGVFDWEFLLPAFEPTRISPMDIDAVVERNGNILCFETKDPGKEVPLGQRITLEAMVRTRFCNVIILRTKRPEDISEWEHWHWTVHGQPGIEKKVFEGNSDDLVRFVRHWFGWAEANPKWGETIWKADAPESVIYHTFPGDRPFE